MKSIALFVCFFLAFSGMIQAQQKKETVNPYADLGQKAVLDGDFKSAIVYMEKALLTDANNVDILYTLGYSYYQTGDYSKAIYSLTKAISLRPEKANAYYFRGKARNTLAAQMNSTLSYVEREKLLRPAIGDFSKCIELNSGQNTEYYQNRALAYRDYAILKEQKTSGIYDKVAAETAYKNCISDLQHILDENPGRKDIADEMKKAKVYMMNLK